MIPGLALLSIGGLLLWRGFTGQSPFDEIRRLLAGESIFVRSEARELGSIRGTGLGLAPEIRQGEPS